MSTKFAALEIPPGVVATSTKKARSSNWSEVNLVRWREGQLTPVGGQTRYNYTFASRCKMIHGWYGLGGTHYTAYLCEQHLYVDVGGTLTDITPLSGFLPVAYGDGAYGDLGYSGDPTYGLTPPAAYNHDGGYSDGAYGDFTYGDPRPSTAITISRLPDAYSLDNFGSILYAMTSADGRLLKWDPAVDVRAVDAPGPISGHAPRGRCFVVTPERFIMMFGMTQDGTSGGGSARRFGWCDQENPSAWDFTNVVSQAGFLDIEPASPIVCAVASRTGVLFWTSQKAYRSRFLGIPYVYNYEELADNCTPWSPQSMVTTSSMMLWMSEQGAFSFDGTSILSVACKVRPWIDDDIDDFNAREEACAVHVSPFNEWWWFFPQGGGANPAGHNTRCVIYNYKEGWWSMGRMARSAGVTAAYGSHVIMANGLSAIEHESSDVFVDAELPWAETFNLNLDGGKLITVKQLMPDIETVDVGNPIAIQDAIGNLRYSLFYRNSRSLGALEQRTEPKLVRTNGYVDFRTTGRDIRLRFDVAGPTVPSITVGQHLIDVAPRGDR